MFGGFRGGFGGPFIPVGNTFPNSFPQETSSPIFNHPTTFPNFTPPSSTPTTSVDNGSSNGAISNDDRGNSSGGGAAAAGTGGNAAVQVTGVANNASKPSTITRSIILPSSDVTITTTQKPLSTLKTDSPATHAASVSATHKNVAPVGIIVGVLFGGISFTLSILLVVLWVRRRRRKASWLGATPYHDTTQVDTRSKEHFELDGHNYLPPYSPPATSSLAGRASPRIDTMVEKPPLLSTTNPAASKTTLQVANRESTMDAARSRWSSSTSNTVFQPPRYATLFRITSRPNTRHPSREHLPLPPPMPKGPIPALPTSPDSDTLSYVTPTKTAAPSRW